MLLSSRFLRLSLILLSLLVVSRAHAFELMGERTSLFEKRHYESWSGDAAMDYYLLKPLNYDSQKSYPLVLTLHGASGHSWGAYVLSLPGMQNAYPAFVLMPRTETNSWEFSQYNDLRPSPLDHVVSIIRSLESEFSIDKKRIYVTGYSMGGYGTTAMLARYPDVFAAGAPLCGGADLKQIPALVPTPLWVFHGALDRNISPQMSRNLVSALKTAGGQPLYSEYPDTGHDVWNKAYYDNRFWKWLFAQQRSTTQSWLDEKVETFTIIKQWLIDGE